MTELNSPDSNFPIVWDEDYLLRLVKMRMPFGKHKGMLVVDLPESYIMWFARKGFPDGKLGGMLKSIYEIKLNGLDAVLDPIRGRIFKGYEPNLRKVLK